MSLRPCCARLNTEHWQTHFRNTCASFTPAGCLSTAVCSVPLQAFTFFKGTGSSDFPAEKQSSIQQSGWDQEGEYVRSAAISLVGSGSTPLICPTGGKRAMFCCGMRIKKNKKFRAGVGFEVIRKSTQVCSVVELESFFTCSAS